MKASVILRSASPFLISLSLVPAVATGADLYWDFNGSGAWATAANWNTAADGSGGDPAAAPTASDTAYFNTTGINTVIATSFGSSTTASVGGLVFKNTGTTAVNTGGTKDVAFTLGAGGITVNSGAGAVTFGNIGAGTRVLFTLGAAQAWTNNSSNTVTLNSGNAIATGGYNLTFGGSGNITSSGAISGSGPLAKTGTGTLILAATNASYSGAVTISGGILQVGAGGTTGTLGTAPSISNNGKLVFNRSSALTWSMPVSGTGNLVKQGAGTLTLSGANSYQGGTVIDRGMLQVNTNTALGTGKVTIGDTDVNASDHSLRLNGVTIGNDVDVKYTYAADYKGAITAIGGTTSTITGDVTVLPNITGAQSRGGHLASDATAGSVLRLEGELNAGGGLTAITQRDGTVEYGGGASTNYTLGVTGTARLAADNGIGSGVLLNLAVSAAATFDLNGFDTTVAGIQKATAAAVATIVTNGGTDDSTLTVSSATSYTFAGVIQDGPTNKVNLLKEGSSTLTLSGNNTYTGTTLVSAGTLLITGALGNTAVTVADGATLGGNGSIGATLVLGADAKLQLGSTLTVPSATLAAGFDMANIEGLSSSTADGTYTLINGTVDLTGVNHVGPENAYPLGSNKLAYFKQGSLQVVVIPEPAAGWLGVLGAAMLFRRRR